MALIETTTLRTLLVPELELEFAKTRKTLEHVPDGHFEFRPHEKSMPFGRLAGHLAEMPSFISLILTSPDIDLATMDLKPFHAETAMQALAQFNELADKALTTVKESTDQRFEQHWKLLRKGHPIFSGTRYEAYRGMGVNHMVHHRAQVGVYLRLLEARVPATYGPSADEQ